MDFDRLFDRREAIDVVTTQEVVQGLAGFGAVLAEAVDGGYSNSNFTVRTRGGEVLFVKIAASGRTDFEQEIGLLRVLSGKVPVPEVQHFDPELRIAGRQVALFNRVAGQPLASVEDEFTVDDAASVGEQLGGALAAIHEVEFERSGFFGPGLTVAEPLEPFSASILAYIAAGLENAQLLTRLPAEVTRRLHRLLPRAAALLQETDPGRRLVHGDFNQKNLLVHRDAGGWQLTAVLDWEFGYSGSPLADFGNLLRFEDKQPGYAAALTAAYRRAGGSLAPGWRGAARVLDLASMVSFLTRDGEYPRTFATARGVMEHTLDLLSAEA